MNNELKPWREIISPHPDVASGRYTQAEFAADLAAVINDKADAEYQDPFEFFRRTHLTGGIRSLLKSSLERLAGQSGEPVIQLKTAFGGGKTHSMLALYHILSGNNKLLRLQSIKEVLSNAGLTDMPNAKRAVLVGTYLDPTKGRPKPELGGGEVRTLWGEMAFQLAGAKGF
ncbi:MAG: hypothetical protein PHU23_03175, partial [Dehalococcoidales bacterium]|nr:hypothetical protein [Dehalococcoidales bacterium]